VLDAHGISSLISPKNIALLTGASAVMLVASALLTPWLLARLPADYFSRPKPHLWERLRSEPPLRKLWLLGHNLVGVVLVGAGVMMLVLPGQGLLTIFLGIVLIDFPGKLALERWLITRPGLLKLVTWLRRKAGQAPFVL
jgi:hypothetical protein